MLTPVTMLTSSQGFQSRPQARVSPAGEGTLRPDRNDPCNLTREEAEMVSLATKNIMAEKQADECLTEGLLASDCLEAVLNG